MSTRLAAAGARGRRPLPLPPPKASQVDVLALGIGGISSSRVGANALQATVASDPIYSTISKDNTAGEQARQGRLLAYLGSRLQSSIGALNSSLSRASFKKVVPLVHPNHQAVEGVIGRREPTHGSNSDHAYPFAVLLFGLKRVDIESGLLLFLRALYSSFCAIRITTYPRNGMSSGSAAVFFSDESDEESVCDYLERLSINHLACRNVRNGESISFSISSRHSSATTKARPRISP